MYKGHVEDRTESRVPSVVAMLTTSVSSVMSNFRSQGNYRYAKPSQQATASSIYACTPHQARTVHAMPLQSNLYTRLCGNPAIVV